MNHLPIPIHSRAQPDIHGQEENPTVSAKPSALQDQDLAQGAYNNLPGM